MPSAWAATLGRDLLREASSSGSPAPGPPTRLARGTTQSAKASAAVDEARWPILSSVRSTVKPGVPFSTMIAEIDFRSSGMSAHLPKTRIRSATSPLVIKVLPPDTTTLSPAGTNRVVIRVVSEPASGSVIASAARAPSTTRGSSRRFCSSVPKSTSGFVAWKLVAQMMPVEAQARLISRTQAR